MSNKTQLQTNNTTLASLIETLQGKAAGGGSSIGTCTVNITSSESLPNVCYTTVENGNITAKHINNVSSETIECICGSALVVNVTSGFIYEESSGLERLHDENGWHFMGVFYIRAYQVTASEGEIATLHVEIGMQQE